MIFIGLVVLLIFLVYIYLKSKYFTWNDSLPGQRPDFLFGNLIQSGILFQGHSLAEVFIRYQKRFGDHFQFWLGPSRFIIVCEIDDIQHIFSQRNIYEQGDVFVEKIGLLFPDGLGCIKGEKFRRHIAATSPMFRRSNIISNLDLIVQCTDILLDHWRRQTSIQTDIVEQSKNLLLDIFGFIAFDYDLEMLKQNKNNPLSKALQDFLSIYSLVIYSPRIVASIFLKFKRRSRKLIRTYFNRMIDEELKETEQSRARRKRTSLIASLVASLQSDDSEQRSKGLTREEILNEMLLFLVAGYESTSSALAWLIHLMSKNRQVQTKIKAELNQQTTLTIEQLDSMTYLDCVIKEVLRYCPPAVGTARTLTTDDRLLKSGIELHRSDSIFIPFHNLARDSRYWTIDPERFYPERFLETDRNYPPLALIPFGGGHRQCIAKDLAQFELKVIAARFMQFVTFIDPGSPLNTGGHHARITIMPKNLAVIVQFDSSLQ